MKDVLVKDIIRECNGKLICGNSDTVCENYCRDSRIIKPGEVYIGIKGENFNGSDFYKEALDKGAIGCILQDTVISNEEINKYKDKFIIIVNNVVEAIQKLAKYKRSLYNIPVIGITGSVGKTSTKDIIASVMSKKYKTLKTEGNYNNEIGLPLTILKLKDHEAIVLEMGMSSLGEISLLTNIAKPTTAVITIIGSSHIGELGSRENILKAKLEILEGLNSNGSLIINNDNDLLYKWNKENTDDHKHITYGIENESDYMARNIKVEKEASKFDITYNNKTYTITVPVGGHHFIYNSLCAICVGLEYGIDIDDIIKGISEFELTKRRMEIIKNSDNIIIVNDSYNASYESMKAALEYINKVEANKKIAVLGDILELGEYSKQMHENVGEEVVKNNMDVLITVGKEAQNISSKALELGMKKDNIYHFNKNEEAANLINQIAKQGDIVLVKASHGMKFDEIVEKIK